jgi:hypothetical protein
VVQAWRCAVEDYHIDVVALEELLKVSVEFGLVSERM